MVSICVRMGSKFKMGNWEIVEIQRNRCQDESFRYANAANRSDQI